MEIHVLACDGYQNNGKEIGLEYEIMTLENTPYTRICPLCNKAFKSFSSRELHFKSCVKDESRKRCQTNIIFCRKCGKSFLMKTAALRHSELCKGSSIRGGIGTKKNTDKITGEQLGVTQKEIKLNMNYLSTTDITKRIYKESRNIVRSKLKENDIKIWCIFEFFVIKNEGSEDENIFPVYINTSAEQVVQGTFFEAVKVWSEYALNSFDEWLENGSGAKFLELTQVDIYIAEFKGDVGGSKGNDRTPIPRDFFKKGRILNIVNEPVNAEYNSCFHTCICAFQEIKNGEIDLGKKKTTRASRIEVGKVLNYTDLDTSRLKSVFQLSSPFSLTNIKKMARLLQPVSFNIFKLSKSSDTGDGSLPPFYLTTIYLGKQGGDNNLNENIANLLYFHEHFYLILDLDGLVQYIKKKRNCHGKLCYNCLNTFDTRKGSFDIHQTTCSKGLKSNIQYAKPGTVQEFKKWSMLVPAFSYVVCDFESSLIPICRDSQDERKATTKKSLHQINSVCAVLYLDEGLYNFPYDLLQDKLLYTDSVKDDTENECEDLIMRFMEHLNFISDVITNWLRTINVEEQKRNLKIQHFDEFSKSTICIYCQEPFNKERRSVFDHSHTHNLFNGAACAACNLLASKQRNLSVFFHNGSKYDNNLLLQHLNFSKFDEHTWSASMIGQKLKLISTNRLEIRDSYALLPEKLSKLAESLTPETSHFQNKYLPYADNHLKGLYPYQWMTSIKKFDQVDFPGYESFRNDLGETCTLDEYKSAREFYEKRCSTFKDYHFYYLVKDALILLDVLQYYRSLLLETTKLDLIRANSLPDISFQTLFYKYKIKKPIISDHQIYSAWEEANKGGINLVGQRYTEVQNPKEERIEYFDIKSSYAASMKHPLPFSDHRYIDIQTPEELVELVHSIDLNCQGLLMNIDCYTPIHIHNFLSDFPPVIEKRIFSSIMYPTEYKAYRRQQKVPKLINHLGKAQKYYCIAQELILMIHLGIVVTKVNCVIQYQSKPFAKPYVVEISELRAEAIKNGNKSKSKIMKLLLCSAYGKFFLNKANYDEVAIVSDKTSYQKKVKSFRFKTSVFNNYSVITKSAQKKIVKDGSPECATTVTALGRVRLLELYYNVLLKYFTRITNLTPHPEVTILYIDTDCLCVYIKIHEEDYTRLMKTKLAKYFDFSNLENDHILYNDERVGEIGILKCETEGRVIKQFLAVCGKCYTVIYFDNGPNTCKCKGIPSSVSKHFSVHDYLQGLLSPNIEITGVKISQKAKYRYIGVNPFLRETFTYEIKKLVLNSLDTKRFLINDGIQTIALGHYKTMPGERRRHGLINNVEIYSVLEK